VALSGTKHFALAEFKCPHCGVALVRPRLLASLETLRSYHAKPIKIESGYRCPVHNAEAGGAHDSQHMYGAAADIPTGVANEQEARLAGFTGIGRARGGWIVHVDVRDGPVVIWDYT
jgi:zinc D-Ala-D-Ala carboxypeptidase